MSGSGHRGRSGNLSARGARVGCTADRSTRTFGVTLYIGGNDNESRISDCKRSSLGCRDRRISARRRADGAYTYRAAFAGVRIRTAYLARAPCGRTQRL